MIALSDLATRINAHSVYRRILRNAGWLFSMQILGGIVGVVTIAMMARALGPAGLGMIAVVQAYTRIVDRLAHLEPWQAVIRNGMEALENNDQDRFRRLIKASILIDIVGSLLAGTIAILLASLIAPLLNLPEEGVRYMQVMSIGLFLTLQSTGIAILRALDRFDLLATLDFSVALVRFALTAVAFWLDLGIWAFILILLAERINSGLIAFVFGMRLLRSRGMGGVMATDISDIRQENPGILRLMWNSNVNVILRQSTQRFDVIILSALTDPAIVGGYFLARRLSEAALKMTRPLSQVIYPELVRLWTSGTVDAFSKLLRRTTLALLALSAICYVPLALNMGSLLAYFFGEEFRDAALLVSVQLLATAIYFAGTLANPAMLTVGKDRELVRITLLSTTLFFVMIVPLISLIGPVGVSLNHLAFNLIWLVGCAFALRAAIAARA